MKIGYPKVQLKDKEGTVVIEEKQLLDGLSMVSVEKRSDGNLADKSFFLPNFYDWVIVKDSTNNLCLVPLIRE